MEKRAEQAENIKQRIDDCVTLLKKGNPAELKELRILLGLEAKTIAAEIDTTEDEIKEWEDGNKTPSTLQKASWRIKISAYIDKDIASYLGTESRETINNYLRLVWSLTP